MKVLIVEQHLKNGHTKVWKLKPEKNHYTFGSSRTADLVSLDLSVGLWECIFEFHNNQWSFIDLNSDNFTKNIYPTLAINDTKVIDRKNSKLILKTVSKNIELNNFQIPLSNSTNKVSYQVFQVIFNDHLLESKILPQGKKFKPESFPAKQGFESIPSSSWHITKFEDYTIKQKTIEFESAKDINSFKLNEIIQKEDQKSAFALMGFCIVLGIGILSLPKQDKYLPTASKRAVATQVIVKTDMMKKIEKQQKVEKPKEVVSEPAPKQNKAPAETAAPAAGDNKNKVAGMLKNVNTGRISSLLSKVSAQGQKSRNVIISDGVAAGSAPSGRALASLGNIDKAGGDWSTESNSKGIKISTKGLGGGNSISGIGNLKGGKVGQGGVGLIEDESEVVGGLDREEIANYIKTQLGQILYCYERQLSANKELFGKVSVKFTISGTGQVEAQAINDSTLKNNNVEGCMLNKIATWKFPAPKGGTKVIVTYPFLFKSTN